MLQLNKCYRLHGTVYISHALVYHHIMVGGQPKLHRQTVAGTCLASVIQIVRCMSKCGGDAKRNLWEFCLDFRFRYAAATAITLLAAYRWYCRVPVNHLLILVKNATCTYMFVRSGVFASVNTASLSLVQPSLCSPDQVLLLLDPEPAISHL